MGQYFKVVNPVRKEYIEPLGGSKAIELCSGDTGKLLAYLLLSGPQDGTAFIYRNANPEDVTQEDRGNERNQDLDGRPLEDEVIAHLKEARKKIKRANKFAGRWAGECITVSGDYAKGGITIDGEHKEHNYYKEIQENEEWTDITEPAYEEFIEFMGENYEPSESMFRPDAALRA